MVTRTPLARALGEAELTPKVSLSTTATASAIGWTTSSTLRNGASRADCDPLPDSKAARARAFWGERGRSTDSGTRGSRLTAHA
jgi:hypothetical protein